MANKHAKHTRCLKYMCGLMLKVSYMISEALYKKYLKGDQVRNNKNVLMKCFKMSQKLTTNKIQTPEQVKR